MIKRRVVYIEDGPWREVLAPAFKNGLAREDVEVENRGNFDKLRQEIGLGDLANVYILDNEITGDREEGAQIAQKIHDRAKELGKEVLIITMLCSNPKGVRDTYGDELDKRGIPVLHKNAHAALCGFYVGRCLGKGKVSLEDWLTQEGVNLPEFNTRIQMVSGEICGSVEKSASGGFYISLRDFVTRNRDELTRSLEPEEVSELNKMLPVTSGREIKE